MTDSLVALITGGGSGMGAATARQLLNLGHRVTIIGRNPDRLSRFAEEVGKPDSLLTISADTTDYDAVESAIDTTVKEFGRLDVAIANAGIATHDDLATGDPKGWRDMVLINVLGPAYLIRASLTALKQTRGRIILVGSVAGHIFLPGNIYGATKWAVTSLAESARLMATADGVGVTLISPGRTETPFWDGLGSLPDGLLLTADQIADSIVWAIQQPVGVDINTMIIRPIGQPV